ncbi:MAG: aminotransferase IV [Gammaproteobacteria bacterium]|nr:aminotransferase IV [Gammaproteobacteria bacterium]
MPALVRAADAACTACRHQRRTAVNLPDPRNADILVNINGELKARRDACISVFDSAVQGGDAVWEGLRIYDGRVADLDGHLKRMRNSAKALAFSGVPSADEIRSAIFATLEANGMRDNAHIRLTLTRGEKVTSGMNPRFNQSGCTLIVLAEWKPPVYSDQGIRVITASVRRNTPQCLDSKIHHNNLLNNILASIEANVAGVDSAIMLDVNGFVSETNDTNLFLVSDGRVLTPHADSCLPGLTRKHVLRLCDEHAISASERNLSLTELYTADEVFTSGTMGELTPVLEADGRVIGDGKAGEVTGRLQTLYRDSAYRNGTPLPF